MDLLKSLNYPQEIIALIKYKISPPNTNKVELSKMTPGLIKCYEYLRLTSRSFAAVIQALDEELRDAVCIFYLVLRALDTVEDDMTIPLVSKEVMLTQFYTYLEQPTWNFTDSAEKDKIVLQDFPTISNEYRRLDSVYRTVISDICRRMGEGMWSFINKSPSTIQDWDLYCHYVAGLVGQGLTGIFLGSGLEDGEVLGGDEGMMLANSMGLFLQKTNIIRDYLEDVLQDRKFWPKQVWGKYVDELIDLSKTENIEVSVQCLNELITNSLHHIPHVLKYLSSLRNQSVFNFCAIPQVMAIATLERCYNNKHVFSGVVKIRKGEAVRLMASATNIENVKSIFSHFTGLIQNRIPARVTSCDQSNSVTSSVTQTSGRTARTENGCVNKQERQSIQHHVNNSNHASTTTTAETLAVEDDKVKLTATNINNNKQSDDSANQSAKPAAVTAKPAADGILSTVAAVEQALLVCRTDVVYKESSCLTDYLLSLPLYISLLLLLFAFIFSRLINNSTEYSSVI